MGFLELTHRAVSAKWKAPASPEDTPVMNDDNRLPLRTPSQDGALPGY